MSGRDPPGSLRCSAHSVVLLGASVAVAVLACALAGCDACTAKGTGAASTGVASDTTTQSVLAAQSAACSECAIRNGCLDPAQQGGVCELTEGRVPVIENGVPNPKTPRDPPPPNAGYTANCLQTLADLFASHCADSMSMTPCLCGSDPDAAAPCLEGIAAPAGPLVRDYANSFNSQNGSAMNANFALQDFGAGQANGIVQCLAAFHCGCCFGFDGGGC